MSKAGLEGIEYYRQYFEISVRRDGMPKHLFTKAEIEALMRNADDRNNNGLVIDENGYARIISDEESTFCIRYILKHGVLGTIMLGNILSYML